MADFREVSRVCVFLFIGHVEIHIGANKNDFYD